MFVNTNATLPPEWDLSDLYALGENDPGLSGDMELGVSLAKDFAGRYRGFWSKPGLTGEQVAAVFQEYQQLQEKIDRPLIFAMLYHSALTTDPGRGKLLAKSRESHSKASQELLFFELEWIQLEEERAGQIVGFPETAPFVHWLEHRRVFRAHTLTEAEEKILERKQLSGRAAFRRLFDETLGTLKFQIEGTPAELSLQGALSKLYDPNRDQRPLAAEGLTKTLESHSRQLGFILNTLVHDHLDDCALRNYPASDMPRNLSNQVSGGLVRLVMETVESRHDLVCRYYKLKANLLGLDKLYDYDRYAPLKGETGTMEWDQARELVVGAYGDFHPEAGRIVSLFFEKSWIDAVPRPGKRSGAFCSSGLASVHPYTLMTYTGRMRDVSTLAHELGHGLHQYLARDRGYLQADAPLVLAETASVFGEMLVHQKILDQTTDPKAKLLLLAGKIEDSFATVFRQIVLTRFEHEVHNARKETGEVSVQDLGNLWMKANQSMFGDSLELNPGYGSWWSYIGHFVHSPFYCYAYAFGELLVLALYAKYLDQGKPFAAAYFEFLAAGGSKSPEKLLNKLGIDWNKAEFWQGGLKLLEKHLETMESLAASIKPETSNS
jgi:oligoendopeptidase F